MEKGKIRKGTRVKELRGKEETGKKGGKGEGKREK